MPEMRTPADTLSWVVLAILLFLVILNALLYYKLWTLEAWAQDSTQGFTVMDLQVLRHPPKSHDEWLQLLQQQEALHNVEMHKWQKVLQAAVQLLRQVNVQRSPFVFQNLYKKHKKIMISEPNSILSLPIYLC